MNLLAFTRFEPLDYACTEAMNTLCTNLSFAAAAGTEGLKIMITSCRPGEGKSFIAMNMMRTLAELGKKVVLVDADLRRSMLTSRYGIEIKSSKPSGVTHYLAGMCNIEDVLYSTDIKGAYVVPMRQEVSNSLSLLNTSRLPLLLNNLAKGFDIVLVDAPPVGVLIDAAEIAKFCDGTLFIVGYNEVSRKELSESKRQIERAGCKVLGAVMNKVTFDTLSSKKYYRRSYYSNYGYGYGYGKRDAKHLKRQADKAEATKTAK